MRRKIRKKAGKFIMQNRSPKTMILKLSDADEEREISFELSFLESLTIQERFQMMHEKNQFINKLLEANGHRKAAGVFK